MFGRDIVIFQFGGLIRGPIQEMAGKATDEEVAGAVRRALRREFRPEFLNRIDEVIIFHSLTKENLKRIVEIQLKDVKRRLAEHKISLEITDVAKERLAEEGYDPAFGARPLRRTIEAGLLNPLSRDILSGKFHEGDVVRVDVKGGKYTFEQVQNDSGESPGPPQD